MESDPTEIIDIYRKHWEIELLFKQMKQNFPLKYFYGESANAIKIQIWITLIANLLLMVMQKNLTRSWSFSDLATMVRITLMYYVDFYSLFDLKHFENYSGIVIVIWLIISVYVFSMLFAFSDDKCIKNGRMIVHFNKQLYLCNPFIDNRI
jgi:hypothetical protein